MCVVLNMLCTEDRNPHFINAVRTFSGREDVWVGGTGQELGRVSVYESPYKDSSANTSVRV